MKVPSRLLVACLAVGMLALLVRLPGLGQFMTVDEENWMLRSAEYWGALQEGNLAGTFITTHPGAVTMWLAGAGSTWQQARTGTEVTPATLGVFRYAATVPIVVATAGLIALIAWLAGRLLSPAAGLTGGFLLAVEPYLVGMSQIVHLDALFALLMLTAVLAWLQHGHRPHPGWLVLAGTAAGLAAGTRLLPALLLPVFFSASMLVTIFTARWRPLLGIRQVLVVIGIAVAVFILVWPAGVIRPFANASYFTRDTETVLQDEHVALAEAQDPIAPATFYLRTLLGRTTPFTLLLALAAITVAARYSWQQRRLVPALWLAGYALLFLVLISFAAKKADRYLLPTLAALTLLAGWALSLLPLILRRYLRPRLLATASVALAVLLVAQTVLLAPYAIAYDNPFADVRPLSQQGWGEGLDGAAAWLNAHPLADELLVASWYPGVLGTYFRGTALTLSSRHDPRVGFVVLYRNMNGRGPDDPATDILREFEGVAPVHVVTVHGQPYAAIYDTLGIHYFSQHVGEVVQDTTVGQTIPIPYANWNAVAIGMATFSSRANTHDIILTVQTDPATEPIRTAVVNAADIVDGEYHRFDFAPIPDSAGKIYYVSLTSPESVAGDAVTVRWREADLLPGTMHLRRRALRAGEAWTHFERPGDIAYRIFHEGE